jgi:hypothetical protein
LIISKNIEKAKGYGLITRHCYSGINIFYTELVGNCPVLLFLACFYISFSDNL